MWDAFYQYILSWYIWTKYNLTVIEKNNPTHAKQFGPIPTSIWSEKREKHISTLLKRKPLVTVIQWDFCGPFAEIRFRKRRQKWRKDKKSTVCPSLCPGCYWNDVLLSLKGALLVISTITLSYTWWRTHTALLSFQQTKPNWWKISNASMRSARA